MVGQNFGLYLAGGIFAGLLLVATLALSLSGGSPWPAPEDDSDRTDATKPSSRVAGPRPGQPELVKIHCPDTIVVDNEGIARFRIRVQRQDFQPKLHLSVRANPDDVAQLPRANLFDDQAARLWREVTQLRAIASGGTWAFATWVESGQEDVVFQSVRFSVQPSPRHFPYLKRGVLTVPVAATATLHSDQPEVIGWGEIRMDLRWGA